MIQNQLYIWGNDEINCRVLCGICGNFFDSTMKALKEETVTCPECETEYTHIDVDETGQCDHGVIGNRKYYTNARLALDGQISTESKPE